MTGSKEGEGKRKPARGALPPGTDGRDAPSSKEMNAKGPAGAGAHVAAGRRSRLAENQASDLPTIISFLSRFWSDYAAERMPTRVVPAENSRFLDTVLEEELPTLPTELKPLLEEVEQLLANETVKTRSPMFLGYVTPPSLEVAALGDALSAIVNQNVSFAALSPVGTALEATVVRWLGQIVGYPQTNGGILTSGGSSANLYGLATARYRLLGHRFSEDGNYADPRHLSIYCSEETHHSVEKAATLLGLGSKGVRRVPTDNSHRVQLDVLRSAIEEDLDGGIAAPMAIVGNAGTRLCCAFDDIAGLRSLADEFGLWLHVDAAYGGFLRLAETPPSGAEAIPLADSVVLDPHKLLFVPFDCGSLLVKRPRHLADCFGSEGEYIEMPLAGALDDYANLGMQLGRSMKALKVWLVLKRFGADLYALEMTRLLSLAKHFSGLVDEHSDFERLGPCDGTAICFRWRKGCQSRARDLDRLNSIVRRSLVQSGLAFIDEVQLKRRTGLRICLTNFNTTASDLESLLDAISDRANATLKAGKWHYG